MTLASPSPSYTVIVGRSLAQGIQFTVGVGGGGGGIEPGTCNYQANVLIGQVGYVTSPILYGNSTKQAFVLIKVQIPTLSHVQITGKSYRHWLVSLVDL